MVYFIFSLLYKLLIITPKFLLEESVKDQLTFIIILLFILLSNFGKKLLSFDLSHYIYIALEKYTHQKLLSLYSTLFLYNIIIDISSKL